MKPNICLIDCQEPLLVEVENVDSLLHNLSLFLSALQELELPLYYTELSPEKNGPILPGIKELLPPESKQISKDHFSAYQSSTFPKESTAPWILVGMQAHISVYQTAKDLLAAKKEVIILNDLIGASNLYALSTAIGQMRDLGAHISCMEAFIYEVLGSDQHESYSEIKALFTTPSHCSCC